MARKAKLYILDEPLGAIDVVARDVVIDAILDSFGEESSMIIVTHLISEIEKLFDDACVLKDGKITLYKNCDELRAEFDMPIRTDNVGPVAVEIFIRFMQIIDKALPILMKAIWA